MSGKIQARSVPGDVRVGSNFVRAVTGGYSLSQRRSDDHIAVAEIAQGQDIGNNLWTLTPKEDGTYLATV